MNTATSIGIELHELISVAVAIVGVLWTLGKVGMAQYMRRMDEKFAASDRRIDDRFQTVDAKLKTLDPLHDELHRIDKDVAQVRLEMATSYVRQEGIRHLTERMETLFKEVFAKLDSKADKSECANHHTERRQ